MKGIIMAGGFGTRLRPLTFNLPKPMVPLLNRPMMKHVCDLMKDHGIEDMVSLLYYLPETISDYFGDGSQFGYNMEYVMAESDLGTAGSVRNATEKIDDTIMVISADVLTNFDLTKAMEFHKKKGSLATILLTRVETPLAFGIVIIDDDGKIKRFLEKPAWGQVFSDTINTGIYILEPEVLEWIPRGEEFDFSKNLFPALLKAGAPLYGYIAPGYWRDVGNLRQYRKANADVLRGVIELNIPGKLQKFESSPNAEIWVEEGANIDPDANFKGRVLVGKDAKIYGGTFIEDSVIGEGTILRPGARLIESVIWDRAEIGQNTQISDALVGTETKIAEECTVLEHAVISDKVDIEANAMISAGVKIWPEKEIGRRAHVTDSFIWGDRLSGELFTNSRVSGKVNLDISPEFASKLGAALGAMVKPGAQVAISRDVDRASQMIERSFFCGLLSAGIDVDDMGVLPIPVMRQELYERNRDAGVHIRRSPREKDQVDIIVLTGQGTDMSTAKCRKIEQLYYRGDFPRVSYENLGLLSRPLHVWENYQDKIEKYIDKDLIAQRQLRVVVDYRFGGAVPILQPILTKLGVRIYPVNAYVDTTRFTKTRDELEISLKELSSVVQTLGADIGFMIDPSAERLSIVDNQGHVFDPQQELYMMTSLFLKTHDVRTVAFPIGATMAVSQLAREHGVKEIRTKGTHLAMMEAALSKEIDFVGGTRGGFVFPGASFAADSMLALLKVLEMIAKLDINIADLVPNIPTYIRKDAEVDCPWHKKGQVMRTLIEKTANMPRDIVDGVRIITSDAWCLAIPDPEDPVFNLTAEATTEKRCDEILGEYAEKIKEWQKEELE
ncbi:MAG: sugar phosphate nucleotidyltransferase [Candidatus Zixiibacteriota bacterium]